MAVDYTQAQNKYNLLKSMAGQNMQPVQGANLGTALSKILTSYFLSKGMGNAGEAMKTAEGDAERKKRMESQAMVDAFTGTTPGQAARSGVDVRPQQNPQALMQAMMGSSNPDFQKMALSQAMAPAPQQKPTGLMQNLIAAGFQPGTPEYQQKMMEIMGKSQVTVNTGDFKVPAGHKVNPNKGKKDASGKVDTRDVVPLEGSTTERQMNKPTATQSTAANYAARMLADNKTLSGLVGQGFDPTQIVEHLADKAGAWGNFLKSPQGQQYRQAQEDWVRAKLRKESGAVIADEEMEREIKVYFPQPGDGPEVLAQKEIQRITATNGMIKEADIAFDGEIMEVPEDIRYRGGQKFLKINGEWFVE